MEVEGKRVSVLGMAESGIAASRLLVKKKARVFLSEMRPRKEWEKEGRIIPAGLECEFGGHSAKVLEAELIIVSPGIPLTLPVLKEARARKIPLIAEIELAFSYLNAPILAVTGTNGKTTTVHLLAEIFREAGIKVGLGGNTNQALSDLAGRNYEVIVAEISSFQCESIMNFRPRIASLLNISPDHLDRYISLSDYLKAKAGLFLNQTPQDYALLPLDSSYFSYFSRKTKARIIPFSQEKKLAEGIFLQDNKIVSRINAKEEIFSLNRVRLKGRHNQENVMVAIANALLYGIKRPPSLRALARFPGLAHRLEDAGEIAGVRFINDSKATNVDALKNALTYVGRMNDPSIILIAGGKDKGGKFAVLAKLVQDKVKKLLLIGQAKEIIRQHLLGKKRNLAERIEMARDLKSAFHLARKYSRRGDTVLLSPGCASFDMFKNFAQRGEAFKRLVSRLKASL